MSTTRTASAAVTGRRSQIVRATVETLAELGYAKTTFVEIAARGGLSSTRLISYHFDDRAELMLTVAATVVSDLGATVETAMRQASSPRAAVHAYLRANVAHIDVHRAEMRALATLLFAGALPTGQADSAATEQAIAALITAGKRAGQFGAVNPTVAAAVLQRAVEGVVFLVHRTPDADLSTLGNDLVAFFDTGLGSVRSIKTA